MADETENFSKLGLDLETAIHLATGQLGILLDPSKRRIVSAESVWDSVEGKQYWVLRYMSAEQFANFNRASSLTRKGGGGMKVTVSSNGEVKHVSSR